MVVSRKQIYQLLFVLVFITSNGVAEAQFAPPAGYTGTTAIHADSNIFIDWASNCLVDRGLVDISQTELGFVTHGSDDYAIGKADNSVVSLGDGGIATLVFDTPISDGDGFDFAVFENSFVDDFLELAFVEVSSNGTDYYRFNSVSNIQNSTQVATFGVVDATLINNLAGKYKALFGTPFDLNELKDVSGLDISNITSVRIIDVVGCIDSVYATYDSQGGIINDPWPTPFETGGFDIDAVGVINNTDNTSVIETVSNSGFIIYPNPVEESFRILSHQNIDIVILYNLQGLVVKKFDIANRNSFIVENLPTGIYIVSILSANRIVNMKLIKE